MIRKLQQLKAKKGFTLVELMVVIAIIGVLAAILIPLMNNFLQNARISSANSTAATARNNVTYWLQEEVQRDRGMTATGLAYFQITVNPAGDRWDVTLVNPSFVPAVTLAPGHAYVAQGGSGKDIVGNGGTLIPNPATGFALGNGENGAAFYVAEYFAILFPDASGATWVISAQNNSAVAAVYSPIGTAIVGAANSLMSDHFPAAVTDGIPINIANGRNSLATSDNHRNITGSAPVIGN
jgi:prepilin-type N-terminal cleavage/methylation domain-containing protein